MFGGPRAEGKPWPRPFPGPLDLEVKHPEANKNIRIAHGIVPSSLQHKVLTLIGKKDSQFGEIMANLPDSNFKVQGNYHTFLSLHAISWSQYLVLYRQLNKYVLNECHPEI